MRDLESLLEALAKAKPGQVVFIPGETTIDLTAPIYIEYLVLEVPEGVTLAGERGHKGSAGALLTSDALDTPVMQSIFRQSLRYCVTPGEAPPYDFSFTIPPNRVAPLRVAHFWCTSLLSLQGAMVSPGAIPSAESALCCSPGVLPISSWGRRVFSCFCDYLANARIGLFCFPVKCIL